MERYRVVAIRFKDGRVKEATLREPLHPELRVPVMMRYFDKGWQQEVYGFGQDIYHWNGKDMTVSGLPLYR